MRRKVSPALHVFVGVSAAWAALSGAPRVLAHFDPIPRPQPSGAAPAAPSTSPQIDGPSRDGDAALRQHAERVASYTMRVTLDAEHHDLRGEATVEWRNDSRIAQKEVYLHLYLNAFKNDHTVLARGPSGGFRGGNTTTDWGYIEVDRFAMRDAGDDLWPKAERAEPAAPPNGPARSDAEGDTTDMRVPLPREVPPGVSATFDVAWHAHLPRLVMRTGYAGRFHMVAQWFPKLARLEPDGRWAHFPFERFSEFYADFGSYDVTVDTPSAAVVGATGSLVETTSNGGRTVRRYLQDDVHDFAFTAWDAFREQTATSDDGVAIRILYPPGYEASARVEIEDVKYGLAYLGAAYGKYPYRTLTIVHPPSEAAEAGGMEYPTLITTGAPWYGVYTPLRLLDSVTIHELGHQWFYGVVATNEHAYPFLDEGVNSYAEIDALEHRRPNASVASIHGVWFGLPAAHRVAATLAEHDAPVAQSAGAFLSGFDYGALVYSRTATTLLTLGRVYGEDVVRRAIGRYTRRYRFEHPGPEEFLAALAEGIGKDAAAAARSALFERGWVDYAVEQVGSHASVAPGGIFGDPAHPSATPATEHAGEWIGGALVRRRGTLRFPVDVDLIASDGSVQRVRWQATDDATRIPYVGRSPLVAAIVDPEQRVMLDDDLTNNAARVDRPWVSAGVLERATFAAELIMLSGAP